MALTRLGDPAIADIRGVNFRNILINGDMSIAQRGTSASTASGYQTVDRFQFNNSSLGVWTVSQSTTVPTGQGFAKSFKVDCTTADASPAASDFLFLMQKIEGQNLQYLKKGTSSAEQLTASFWVRSNKTGTYICELQDMDNSRTVSKSYTISSADTWEKQTLTFPADTTGAFDNDNANSLQLNLYLAVGSDRSSGTLATTWASTTAANRAVGQVNLADSTSNEWYVTGVQLEAGSQASDFEFLPFDVNLKRCQRYFEKSYQMADAPGTSGSGGSYGLQFGGATANIDASIIMSTRKRATPTLTVYDLAGTSNKASYYTGSWNNGGSLGGSRGRETYVHVDTNISSSSIVAWHFTADAEL
jgi:hypothetical protein|tara:strand:- start:168 stop:1247 length:1080 start_codon:yes stop_codon:yes gene_type:complete